MPFGNIFKKGKHSQEKAEESKEQKPQDDAASEGSLDDIPGIDSVSDNSDSWLNGQEGHLSPEQAKAFDNFKVALQKEGLYTPAADGKPASSDDSTLLRFLRARRFDVQGGLKQFQDTEKWRRENHIDELYATIDIDSYEESRRMYPQWTGRRDKRGIPVYVFVIKHLNSKNMAAYTEKADKVPVSADKQYNESSVPNRLLRLFALYENMIQFVGPLCSSLPRPNPESPIVATTNIVDISGVGLKQFWNLKGHMQDASVLATAHYPETLDRIYIIGAPAFFPTVWGWIKRWFDPVTTSKIFILSASEVKSTLERFMPPTSFPKQYGGELDWQWGDMPNFDEPARQIAGALERVDPRTAYGDVTAPPDVNHAKSESTKPSFLVGPVKWLGDRLEILGSLAGAIRHRVVTIADQTQSAAAASSATASAAKPAAADPPATAPPRTNSTTTTTTMPPRDGITKTSTHVDAESETGEDGVHVDAHSDIEISKRT